MNTGRVDTAERLYCQGELQKAEAITRRLLRDGPVEAVLLLSKILIETGRPQQAVYEVERALSQNRGSRPLQMALHNAAIACGKPERALEVAEGVFVEEPDAEVACAVASLHFSQGRMTDAEQWYERALQLCPGLSRAELGLARVLSGSLRGTEALERLRKLGAGGTAVARLTAFQIQYVSGVPEDLVYQAQCLAGQLAAREVDGLPPRVTRDRDPSRKVTIGYLSPDFRQHSCSHFIEPLLSGRDPKGFRVIAYSGVNQPDEVTRRLRSMVDVWRDAWMLSDSALASRMAADGVDVAVDLAGHTGGSRMACLALRPAPVTATYLGYPGTTGAPGIDYRIVDSVTDPAGTEGLATEHLIRLDPCFLCFRPSKDAPEVGAPPRERNGFVTFGSFNVLDKVSEATLDVWADVLRSVPDARMLVKSRSLADEGVRRRLADALAMRGVAAERVDAVGWETSLGDHLGAYGRIDIALDTLPYNGTTTTCEALWMGVPVVTVAGRMHAGRVGASLLRAVGLGELVGDDAASMARIAAALAEDPDRLRGLRAGLRQRVAASPLRDERGFAQRFEGVVRLLWRRWCAGA